MLKTVQMGLEQTEEQAHQDIAHVHLDPLHVGQPAHQEVFQLNVESAHVVEPAHEYTAQIEAWPARYETYHASVAEDDGWAFVPEEREDFFGKTEEHFDSEIEFPWGQSLISGPIMLAEGLIDGLDSELLSGGNAVLFARLTVSGELFFFAEVSDAVLSSCFGAQADPVCLHPNLLLLHNLTV